MYTVYMFFYTTMYLCLPFISELLSARACWKCQLHVLEMYYKQTLIRNQNKHINVCSCVVCVFYSIFVCKSVCVQSMFYRRDGGCLGFDWFFIAFMWQRVTYQSSWTIYIGNSYLRDNGCKQLHGWSTVRYHCNIELTNYIMRNIVLLDNIELRLINNRALTRHGIYNTVRGQYTVSVQYCQVISH